MYKRTKFCPASSPTPARSLPFTPLLPKISRLAAIFFFLITFAFVASAQEGTIVGTVSDPSGAVVPNAKVIITNTDKNQSFDVMSNESGQFVAPSLGIGHYKVKAEVSGFKSFEQNDINLQVGDRLRVDVKLEVGNTHESVTVEAEAIAVKSESGEVSDVITGKEMTPDCDQRPQPLCSRDFDSGRVQQYGRPEFADFDRRRCERQFQRTSRESQFVDD